MKKVKVALLSLNLVGLILETSFAIPDVRIGDIASGEVQDCPLCQLPSAVIEKEIVALLTIKDVKNLRATSKVARDWCVSFLAGIKAQRAAIGTLLAEEAYPHLQDSFKLNYRIIGGTELLEFLRDLKGSGDALTHLKDFKIAAISSPDLLTVCLQSLNGHAQYLDLSSVKINWNRSNYLLSCLGFHVQRVSHLLTLNWSAMQSRFHFAPESADMCALSTYSNLQKLTLDVTFLNSRDTVSVAIMLSEHASRVRSLKLSSAHLFYFPEMPILARVLRSFCMLEHLDLTGACMDRVGAMYLATVVSAVASHLRALNLSFVSLGGAQMRTLAPALQSLNRLEHLTLSGIHTDADVESVSFLGEVFSIVGSQLVSLNLSQLYFSSMDLKQLAPALTSLTRLKSLDLSRNNLSSEDSSMWGSLLLGSAGLEDLNLASNYFDALGVRHLNRALITLSRLRSLNLSGNPLSVEGLDCLLCVSTRLTALRELVLSYTVSEQDGGRVLARVLLGLPGQLQTLDIGGNELGFDGIRCLERALISQTGLQRLSLCRNEFGWKAKPILVFILSKLEGLQEVDLTGNELRIYRKLRPVEALKSLQNW
jgi:Ran GTPase-activating protein (RanGAP) involved in mRNA processing and transport